MIIRFLKNTLSLALIALAVYTMLLPYMPELRFWVDPPQLQTSIAQDLSEKYLFEPPEENMLIIPQIGVAGQIWEGQDEEVLDNGIWHRPHTSTPDKGGNSVFTAHRYLYQSGPNTFYHLDKLKKGDEFVVYWDQNKYHYKVSHIFEVTPDHVEIEYNTEEPIVTLYTCTPLWTSKNRLVIQAEKV